MDGAKGEHSVTSKPAGRLHALGPGVLYAATAVGTSHLVQSTRAGAGYGLALVLFILLTYVAKYPAFRFGAQYAGATGRSLLHGYRLQGNWAVGVYIVIALGTVFAALPAVTLVTAGLVTAAFRVGLPTFTVAAMILVACAGVLLGGGYPLLDRIVKVLMAVLAASTVLATVLVIPRIDWAVSGALLPSAIGPADVFFIVALLGFMPSSVDISVWHSLWSVARARDSGRQATLSGSLDDFHVGFVGTFLLAVCFVLLGTGVMHNAGLAFETSPAGFASQLIDLYRQTLGDWSGPLIGAIAVAVMFSTVLTGLDGYPRAAVSILRQYGGRSVDDERQAASDRRVYAAAVVVLAIGSLVILYFLVSSLQAVVDVAATIMFLFAPVIAWLNHRVMNGDSVPGEARPALDVMTGIYTGRQRVFAFPAGALPPRDASWMILLGWGVVILLGGLYAGSPRFRYMVPRYFTAHGFYREAVREGRDVLPVVTLGLVVALALSAGMVATVVVRAIDENQAILWLLRRLPAGGRETLLGLLVQPWLLLLLVGSIYAFGVGAQAALFSVVARRRPRLAPGQAFMLTVWPRWPLLALMVAAMVLSASPPTPPRSALWLALAWLLVALLTLLRTLYDFARITRTSLAPTLLVSLAHPLFLLAVVGAGLSLFFFPDATFLWHLITRG